MKLTKIVEQVDQFNDDISLAFKKITIHWDKNERIFTIKNGNVLEGYFEPESYYIKIDSKPIDKFFKSIFSSLKIRAVNDENLDDGKGGQGKIANYDIGKSGSKKLFKLFHNLVTPTRYSAASPYFYSLPFEDSK